MGTLNELVSVVIPTAGRRPTALAEAVRSVAAQDAAVPLEIVIADDSDNALDKPSLSLAAGSVNIRFVPTNREMGLARQFGVDSARGEWIAFLDDDDVWDSSKIRVQLELAGKVKAEGYVPVVSSRLRHSFSSTDRVVSGVPDRLIGGEDVARYLFRRRPAKVGRPSIFTSTLLVPISVCRATPWRVVPRHQDWDWLIRAQDYPQVRFVQCPEELVTIAVGSSDSISARSDWRSSLDWAISVLKTREDSEVYVDFLFAQPLRYALQARDGHGLRAVISEIFASGASPSVQAAATGLAGMVSRPLMERLMSIAPSRQPN